MNVLLITVVSWLTIILHEEVHNVFIFLLYLCAVNALTFEANAYYYTESRRLLNNQRVVLSQATDVPVFAEMLLEGGDGDDAASGEIAVYDVVVVSANPILTYINYVLDCFIK